jgi:hypothetical protein
MSSPENVVGIVIDLRGNSEGYMIMMIFANAAIRLINDPINYENIIPPVGLIVHFLLPYLTPNIP